MLLGRSCYATAAMTFLALSLPLLAHGQSIPLVPSCSADESPVFLLQHNASVPLATVALRSVQVSGGFLECSELCTAANFFASPLPPLLPGGGPQLALSLRSLHLRPSLLLAHLLGAALGAKISAAANETLLAECAEVRELVTDLQDCVGVQYAAADSQCRLLGARGGAEPAPKDEVANADDAAADANNKRIVTKSCVKSERICSSPFHFDVHEQKILVGFAREVVAADSVQKCLAACLNSFDTFGFECESLMYYPVDAECILNTEDRLDRPDLFVDENEDTVIYMDNNCAGSQCYAPYVTQYVAVEGRQLADELDQRYEGLERGECEELCNQRLSSSANDFNCKAFMYSNQTRSCVLSDERSRPLGRARLAEVPGWTYYEKKCFASPRTCRDVPSFTRVPQMLLVGFASFVMENVPSVTMCLDQCTNPPPETGQNFVCKSVMYYYNEQECILNAESRHSKPDLFIPEEDDFIVDYFDINCRLEQEQCPDGSAMRLVRTLNAALPEGESAIHVVETAQAGVPQCAQKCAEHAADKCRAFNYDRSSGTCNLLYLDGRGSLRPEPKAQVDLYDLHCLDAAAEATSAQCVDPEGAVFSRHLHSAWTGAVPSSQQHSVPLSKCLNLCVAESCEGLNYNRRNGTCALFARMGERQLVEMEKSEHVDFYQNVCTVRERQTEESSAKNVPRAKERAQPTVDGGDIDRLNAFNQRTTTREPKKPQIRQPDEFRHVPPKPASAGTSDGSSLPPKETAPADGSKQFGLPTAIDRKAEQPNVVSSLNINNVGPAPAAPLDPAQMPTPVQIRASQVHTICNYEGISVQVKHGQPFSGVMFVKNKYDTCRVEVEGKDSVTLVLGLPANFGMKPITLNGPSSGGKPHRPKALSDATLAIEKQNNGTSAEGEEEPPVENIDAAQEAKRHKTRLRRQLQRDCGLVDMDNGTYKTVVVVQTNNLGIPGLVTSMDQLYEISCNYSSMLGGKVTAAANLTVGAHQPSLIQPRGKIELGNPVLMQMAPIRSERTQKAAKIGIVGEQEEQAEEESAIGGPLVQAKLGDILELRWEIMAMDDELDFFVRDCYAEPGIAPPKVGESGKASTERLQLVQGGCPTPAVAQKLIPNPIKVLSSSVKVAHLQAFRFDSSSTVRITCALELCKGDCKAVNCKMVDGFRESWGRKKRDTRDNGVTEFETRRFKVPRFAQATTSIVIVDPLQKFSDPAQPFQAHSQLSRLDASEEQRSNQTAATELKTRTAATEEMGDSSFEQFDSELCVHKWTLFGVLGTLLALIVLQTGVVAKYMFARLLLQQQK